MRKIDPSFITPTLGQPFKQGTWYHLMNAINDITTGMVTSMVGDTYSLSAVYKLIGCEMTGSGTRTFTAGWVSYNGELFYFAGATLPAPTTGVFVCNIGTTYFTDPIADPVTFTDGITTHNVHEIRTMTISEAATHTGTMGGVDFSEITYVGQLPTRLDTSGLFIGTYDFTLKVKGHTLFTSPLPATPTFNIVDTDQVIGNTVRFYWEGAAGTGSSVTFTATSGVIIGDTGALLTAGQKGIGEFTFIGNDGTNNIYLAKTY